MFLCIHRFSVFNINYSFKAVLLLNCLMSKTGKTMFYCDHGARLLRVEARSDFAILLALFQRFCFKLEMFIQ